MSFANLDVNSMPAVVVTPQLSQEDRVHLAFASQDTYGNPAPLSINISAPTPLRQSSHRLESATQVAGKNITPVDSKSHRTSSHLLPVTSVDRRSSSSAQSRLPLDNQGIANVDAAIHAWRQDIGQNHGGESRFYPSTSSPPAAPSLQKDTTFNPSTSCSATNKFSASANSNAERTTASSGCVERAALARGNSEVSKQCTTKTSVCEPSSLEAKRQKDLVVTEKMIGTSFGSACCQGVVGGARHLETSSFSPIVLLICSSGLFLPQSRNCKSYRKSFSRIDCKYRPRS